MKGLIKLLVISVVTGAACEAGRELWNNKLVVKAKATTFFGKVKSAFDTKEA